MWLLLLGVLAVDLPELVKQAKSSPIDVGYYSDHPRLCVDGDGNLFFASYTGGYLKKFDKDGKLLFFTRADDVPNGFNRIKSLVAPNGKVIWAYSQEGRRLIELDSRTGKFIRYVMKGKILFRPTLTEQGAILVFMRNVERRQEYRMGLMDDTGTIVKTWEFELGDLFKGRSGGEVFFAKRNEDFYWAVSLFPEIMVHENLGFNHRVWDLKPPKYFAPIPDEPKNMFSRVAFYDYYNSFSQIYGIHVVENKYLVVCWRLNNNRRFSLDFYDLQSEERVIANLPVPGWLIRINGNKLYMLQDDELFVPDLVEPDEESQRPVLFHTWELDLPGVR